MSIPVILASSSPTRRRMLEAAGVELHVEAPRVDEDEVKHALRGAGMAVAEVAEALADLKASRIAARNPGTIVLGADQMLDLDGDWLDKPADLAAAAVHLQRLSGRRHRLISAVVAYRNGARVWHTTAEVRLTMRPLSAEFIESYLNLAGDDVLGSVGAYRLEGLGAQLFSAVDGDFFCVLGLPLLPVLDFLRVQGVLRS